MYIFHYNFYFRHVVGNDGTNRRDIPEGETVYRYVHMKQPMLIYMAIFKKYFLLVKTRPAGKNKKHNPVDRFVKIKI